MMAIPKWKSHKVVEAARVTGVLDEPLRWVLLTGDSVPVSVELELRARRNPIGGYYVRYPDGYESWSPAEAFEDGYSLIEGEHGAA